MARIGVFCFAGTGHLNPFCALSRRLQQRGHSVVIFGIADVENAVRSAGIDFRQIGQSDYPPGTLKKLDQHLSQQKGLAIFRVTIDRIRKTALMVLRDGPQAVRDAGIDLMLVDEADFGGTVADFLQIPFISVACLPPFILDNRIPPFVFPWGAGRNALTRLRNQLAIWLLTAVASPIFSAVNRQRRAWGLKPFRRSSDALSPLAQITQLPAALEFDVDNLPSDLHYTGPFLDPAQRPTIDFPWDKLDGRPLVYASLGTLQNGVERIFRIIAEGCAPLPIQLVLSLGGGLEPSRLGKLPGDPIVIQYAPQLDLLKRAQVVITHAGINTAIESLLEGVPMVCIPMGNDQPGVAARVAARGAGLVLSPRTLNPNRLGSAVQRVLDNQDYRTAALRVQASMRQIDGLQKAADVVEEVLRQIQPSLATKPQPT